MSEEKEISEAEFEEWLRLRVSDIDVRHYFRAYVDYERRRAFEAGWKGALDRDNGRRPNNFADSLSHYLASLKK